MKKQIKKNWLQYVKIIGSVNTGFILYYRNVPVFSGNMPELQNALKFLGLELEQKKRALN